MMKGMMNAVVLEGKEKLVYKKLPIPEIGPEDLLVKISYASVCGSDLPIYKDLHYLSKLPIIPGHEFSGYAVEVGEKVKDIPLGTRFMGSNVEWCGECEKCRAGHIFECPTIINRVFGFGRDGVFAEYAVVHKARLGVSVIPLPDSINDLVGSTCEPMSVGIGNLEYGIKPQDNERIVIYGAGTVGQSFIQAFKAMCKCEIAVVDLSDLRLELAKKSGADYIINPADGESSYDVLTQLWGYGEFSYHDKASKACGNATIAVECSGNSGCVTEAMEIVTNKGKVCYAAGYGDEDVAQIRPLNFILKNVNVICGSMGSFTRSVELMGKGVFSTEHLITHVYPLEQAQDAIRMAMDSKRSGKVCIKVDPNTPDYPYNRQD